MSFCFLLWRCDPTRVIASSFLRFLDHTQRRTTVGRTPLDEWSTPRRDLYQITHNTHNRQTSMPSVGFEPTISAGERPQTYALERAATGTGTLCFIYATKLKQISCSYTRERNILPEQQVGNDARIIQYITNDLNTKSLKTLLENLQILTCVTTKAHKAHGFLIRYLVLTFWNLTFISVVYKYWVHISHRKKFIPTKRRNDHAVWRNNRYLLGDS